LRKLFAGVGVICMYWIQKQRLFFSQYNVYHAVFVEG